MLIKNYFHSVMNALWKGYYFWAFCRWQILLIEYKELLLKNNIGFFTHEVEAANHRKFIILRAYYGGEKGWAMEGRFWALNSLIGKTDRYSVAVLL
jgi:hypothetical protein